MSASDFRTQEAHGFRYIDEGDASSKPPVFLLHGMLGDLSNWDQTVHFLISKGYRVVAPELPVYNLPLRETNVQGLVSHAREFAEAIELPPAVVTGNSLGGQVALFYTLQFPDSVASLVLSGASGIYEQRMGTSTLRRKDRSFIRERAAVTFYDDELVTDELVEEMYALVNSRPKALRLIKMARSSKRDSVTDRLDEIYQPALLIWGRDDEITPPDVAREFQQRLPNAELHFLEKCGHAPMMERPSAFNRLMKDFLERLTQPNRSFASGT